MNNEKPAPCCKQNHVFKHHSGGSNAIYGLGVIGALFYFLQHVHNAGEAIVGIGKAFFWPAILMFKLMTYLKM